MIMHIGNLTATLPFQKASDEVDHQIQTML